MEIYWTIAPGGGTPTKPFLQQRRRELFDSGRKRSRPADTISAPAGHALRVPGRQHVIYAKSEQVNMTGSIKDRMKLHILKEAYATQQRRLCPYPKASLRVRDERHRLRLPRAPPLFKRQGRGTRE